MRTLILGIGNDILTDDGIGPRIVHDLEKSSLRKDVVWSRHTLGGLEALEAMKDFDRIIVIDAIKTHGGIPGEIYRFTADSFRETLHLSNLHDVNFLTAMELGKRLGYKTPDEIHIFAVEIAEDRVFSTSFSAELEPLYPAILEEIRTAVAGLLEEAEVQSTERS